MKAFHDDPKLKQQLREQYGKYQATSMLAIGDTSGSSRTDIAGAFAWPYHINMAGTTKGSPYEAIEKKYGFPAFFMQMLAMIWHYSPSLNMAISMGHFFLRQLPIGMDMTRLQAHWMCRMLAHDDCGIAQYLSIRDRAHLLNAVTILSSHDMLLQLSSELRQGFYREYMSSAEVANGPLGRAALKACAYALCTPDDYPVLNTGHMFISHVVEVLVMAKVPTKNWEHKQAALASTSFEREQYQQCKNHLWDAITDMQKRSQPRDRKYPLAADADL